MKPPSGLVRVADELGAEAVTMRVLAKRAPPQMAADLGDMARRLDILAAALRAETRPPSARRTKGVAA